MVEGNDAFVLHSEQRTRIFWQMIKIKTMIFHTVIKLESSTWVK